MLENSDFFFPRRPGAGEGSLEGLKMSNLGAFVRTWEPTYLPAHLPTPPRKSDIRRNFGPFVRNQIRPRPDFGPRFVRTQNRPLSELVGVLRQSNRASPTLLSFLRWLFAVSTADGVLRIELGGDWITEPDQDLPLSFRKLPRFSFLNIDDDDEILLLPLRFPV